MGNLILCSVAKLGDVAQLIRAVVIDQNIEVEGPEVEGPSVWSSVFSGLPDQGCQSNLHVTYQVYYVRGRGTEWVRGKYTFLPS